MVAPKNGRRLDRGMSDRLNSTAIQEPLESMDAKRAGACRGRPTRRAEFQLVLYEAL